MKLRQEFAKKTLKLSNKKYLKDHDTISNAVILSIVVGLGAGLGTASTYNKLERDPGNQYEQDIYNYHDNVVTKLEQQKQEYTQTYAAVFEKEAKLSNLESFANSLNLSFDGLFFTDFDATPDEILLEQSRKDWKSIKDATKIIANKVQTEDKISERDAEKITTRLNNIVPFRNMGYQGLPDAGDLRECQQRFSTAKTINDCSIDKNLGPASKGTFAFSGALIALGLFPGIPLAAKGLDKKQGRRLRRWADGKPARPDH